MSEPERGWRKAKPTDLDAVRFFMSEREAFATGLSGRILAPAGGLKLPTRPGGLYVFQGDQIEALAAFMSTGTTFPIAPSEGSFDRFLSLRRLSALRTYRPASCVGLAATVDDLESAFAWTPACRINYRVMSLDRGDFKPSARTAASVRRAGPKDLDALYPLAEAYEKEEVITALHRFAPGVCRAQQARSLCEQIVYLVEADGRVAARAQTNARGWTRDQIGGVFVIPAFRGRGLGRLAVETLVRDRLEAGRGLSLFVKESNDVATGLYVSMGFRMQGSYRVDYFR
ncbi:MAG: GNAT family N-acetyltransferase [Spirochaetales bacterium]|nr:MAG: GNAT family N-acetyltransferase [Spirochaetales bacterium]